MHVQYTGMLVHLDREPGVLRRTRRNLVLWYATRALRFRFMCDRQDQKFVDSGTARGPTQHYYAQ
jgi:hypothetical protein